MDVSDFMENVFKCPGKHICSCHGISRIYTCLSLDSSSISLPRSLSNLCCSFKMLELPLHHDFVSHEQLLCVARCCVVCVCCMCVCDMLRPLYSALYRTFSCRIHICIRKFHMWIQNFICSCSVRSVTTTWRAELFDEYGTNMALMKFLKESLNTCQSSDAYPAPVHISRLILVSPFASLYSKLFI